MELELCHVLARDNAISYIPSLAMLTRLQWLVVQSGAQIVNKHVWKGNSWQEQRVLDKDVVVRRGDVQPLAALRMLEDWDLLSAWRWEFDNPDPVVAELCGVSESSFQPRSWKWPRWKGSAFTRFLETQ